jgi:peptidoglycan/xylan/chitin deacetylase (PgdA/CDA1 family)
MTIALLGLLACRGDPEPSGEHGSMTPTQTPAVPNPAAPPTDPSAAPAVAPPEAASTGIPVLLFHTICASRCDTDEIYGTTAAELDDLLSVLDARGYTAISIAAFAAFRSGQGVALPKRPVLLTFDDGRASAYANATRLLLAHHARATMFVITDKPGGGDPFFMTWADLEGADASGAWDLELHAHEGHRAIPTGPTTTGPFYAWRAWNDSASLEPLDAWYARMRSDIEAGEAALTQRVPAHVPHAFAVPFSDYGQIHSNDPEIPVDLAEYLDAHYAAWFVQMGDPPFAMPGPGARTFRYSVERKTTVADVASWLARHDHL